MRGRKQTDPDAKPILVFRPCKPFCTRECVEHGYFWGLGHEKEAWRGKRASWPKENGYSGTAA
jgi:hypothetical protein